MPTSVTPPIALPCRSASRHTAEGQGGGAPTGAALTLIPHGERVAAPGAGTPMSQAFISVEGLTRRFPSAAAGSSPCSRTCGSRVAEGEFACVIGHSGCGKSTILNILAGLDAPTAGHIIAAGKHVHRPEPRPRRDLPGPRADALAVGARQRRARRLLAPSRLVAQPDPRARHEVPGAGAPRRLGDEEAGAALRRHEAARRHRPRARHRAAHAADGRAVLRARCAHARLAAGRGDRHPQARRARPCS